MLKIEQKGGDDMSMYLFDEQPIVANKVLARALELNEDLVLQSINYWIEINKKSGKNYYDEKYWTYIFYEAPREEKNFATLLDMIDASEVREDDETYMNPIDKLFEALEKKEPTHFLVKQYKKYKLATGVIELRRTLHHYLSERCFA